MYLPSQIIVIVVRAVPSRAVIKFQNFCFFQHEKKIYEDAAGILPFPVLVGGFKNIRWKKYSRFAVQVLKKCCSPAKQ